MERRRRLDTFEDDGVEESDELMAAINEGIRSLEAQDSIPIEQARKRFLDRWGTRSSCGWRPKLISIGLWPVLRVTIPLPRSDLGWSCWMRY
jgi:hypothetical protein